MDEDISVKRRKFNWSQEEIDVLSESISARIGVIQGRFNVTLTHNDKKRSWEEVVKLVNSVSQTVRTQKECYKKWADLKNNVKKKAASAATERKKTGGGTSKAPDMKSHEQQILGTLSKSAIQGITGGFDTSSEDTEETQMISVHRSSETLPQEVEPVEYETVTIGHVPSSMPETSTSCFDLNSSTLASIAPMASQNKTVYSQSSVDLAVEPQSKVNMPEEKHASVRKSPDFGTTLLSFEREKREEERNYRERKLKILSEMLEEQRNIRKCLEKIANDVGGNDSANLFCVSPVIHLPMNES